MPKSFKKLFILILIFSWFFFGWPQILNFPPGIQMAQAALPTFVAAGVVTKGVGVITPAMPSGVLTNDILLLFIETADQAITVSGGTETWTAVTGSPVTGAVGTDLTVFWARASQNSPTSPDTSDSGDHQLAVILAVRGVITSGNPWDASPATGTAGSGTSVSFPSVITTVADTFIVHAIAGDGPDGNSTANLSGETNSNLTNPLERSDDRVNTGNGGLLGTYTGEKASTGSVGNTTAALANAATQAMITIALKPAPSTITVGTTGTQTANMNIPSTNQYVGGAFTFIRNESTANVTSITISETDATLSAQSYLANLDLYYETAGTCTYDGTETLFGTDTAFDASEDAVITGTMAVGTSQVCLYAVLDVVSGAPDADSFDLEITDPSTEVIVSAGVVSPATAVAISGATTINLAPAVKQDHYRWRNDNGPQGNQPQTLYFNPTGNGFGAVGFSIVGGCAAGSEWDCVDDGTADTQSTAPSSDLETSQLLLAAATDYYTLADDQLLAGSTITQLDITVSGADDVGNPNTSVTLGYCIVGGANDCGTSDTMGAAQNITAADQTKTEQFTGLSLSTTDLNNMQLVLTGSGAKAEISTLYVLVTYSVSEATWRQAEDIVETGLAKSTNIRLRFQIDNTGGSANSYNYRLEWAARGVDDSCDTSYTNESYAAVPDTATTEHFDMTLSAAPGYVDGESTTAKLSNAESYTFVAGTTVESTSNQSGAITLAQNQYTEVEYVFQANANATDGGVYCFRVTNAGTALDSADVVAQITLAGGGGGPTLTFSISDNSIGFGTLSASVARYANGAGTGDTVEVEAHTLIASTNATNGYVITADGTTLRSTPTTITITSIGGTNTASSPGSEQFGLRMTATGGNGSVFAPYAASGFALDAAAFPDQIASDPDGDDVSTTYSVRYITNITNITEAGSYSATLTYVATATF